MRCRNCGLELEAQDKLRNGAYRCPMCGTIHHTASSSRRSPSPWRRHRSAVAREENPLTRRYFGFPLWSMLAAGLALVLIVVIIVLLVRGGASKPAEEVGTPGATDVPATSETVDPNAGAAALESAPVAPEATPTTGSTGVALNDFLVSFDWAMDYLEFNDRLTLVDTKTATDGSIIQTYSFSDWYDLELTLAADGVTIRAASSTGRVPAGSTDSLRVQKAFVSELYSFDNTINAVACRSEVEAMMADNTRAYGKTNFSARITNGEGGASYELAVRGMLDG